MQANLYLTAIFVHWFSVSQLLAFPVACTS